jgi:hypothetical protein
MLHIACTWGPRISTHCAHSRRSFVFFGLVPQLHLCGNTILVTSDLHFQQMPLVAGFGHRSIIDPYSCTKYILFYLTDGSTDRLSGFGIRTEEYLWLHHCP